MNTALSLTVICFLLWAIFKYFSRTDDKAAKLAEKKETALELLVVVQELVKTHPLVRQEIVTQHSVSDNILQLVFEVRRRELNGTAHQMFHVRVSGTGAPSISSFFKERYDHSTGKSRLGRSNNKLRLALSQEATGVFAFDCQPIRGGSIWKGLALSKKGRAILETALRSALDYTKNGETHDSESRHRALN